MESIVVVSVLVNLILLCVIWYMQRKQKGEGVVASTLIVSGVSVGLPGSGVSVFSSDNFDALVRGDCRIEQLANKQVDALLERKIVQMKKQKGEIVKVPIEKRSQTIAVAARLGVIDLEKYGVPKPLAKTMGRASQVAVAAGLEALQDAGLVSEATGWRLPEKFQSSTGVVYATSFPALDAAIAEVDRHAKANAMSTVKESELLDELDRRLRHRSDLNGMTKDRLNLLRSSMIPKSTAPAKGDEKNYRNQDSENPQDDNDIHLLPRQPPQATVATKPKPQQHDHTTVSENYSSSKYAFDRKFLFKVLVLGNSQLAQIIGARGPNLQTNAACAGTTQALGLAQDLIASGRCERVIVIAGDDATGDALLPWLGAGFNALGAASISPSVRSAVHPFDARRNGMILGAGACGLVLERAALLHPGPYVSCLGKRAHGRCRLLATRFTNSAYHGAAMDKNHIADELNHFLDHLLHNFGLDRSTIARRGMYLSHETGTHATPSSSCAANEMYALARNFKPNDLQHFLILNTKALTGHPMGVGVEDALAAYLLSQNPVPVPPIPADTKLDPSLPADLALAIRGTRRAQPRYDVDFALRFAAGFGSQVAFAFFAKF